MTNMSNMMTMTVTWPRRNRSFNCKKSSVSMKKKKLFSKSFCIEVWENWDGATDPLTGETLTPLAITLSLNLNNF